MPKAPLVLRIRAPHLPDSEEILVGTDFDTLINTYYRMHPSLTPEDTVVWECEGL